MLSTSFVFGGCGEHVPLTASTAGFGSIDVAVVQGGVTLSSVAYSITGPNSFSLTGTVNVSASSTISALIGGLPAGMGYTIALTSTSVDGATTCGGTSSFNITASAVTTVTVTLDCHQPPKTGSVGINGTLNVCPVADGLSASPTDVAVGFPIALTITAHDSDSGPSPLGYSWTAPSGTFSSPTSANPTFTCTVPGPVTVTATASDGDPAAGCAATASVVITCEPSTLLVPHSLVISTSTYDRTVGAVASLTVGTKLAGTATATSSATTGNNYVTVWNNELVDSSFGVTSPIQITDIDPSSKQVLSRVTVPTDQVVTSFPSKSELGLHITTDMAGPHLVFVAYGGAGVGALDVSNSDAVPGQDPTNPVTFAFGSAYAFPRTVVSMDGTGHFSYTPTVNYGGNNGRSALLGSNGLYYTVGNANNGSASTFGPNGTNPDVTETTGLEVVNPINGASSSVAIPANNSAEVNPLLQYSFGTPPKADKAGKDTNYRGIAEFGGALYFTKGSGSNGVQTVYTVPTLPTVANAASTMISIVPGFPTDSAKATGGNFTPFAVFFANATTMYVSDEGSGNTTDTTTHAGLEKWSLVAGTWQLDYVLTQGLIGQVDSGLTGPDGAWPAVTTVGLRNLTGVVNGDQVTLWATTSTSSTSGDNGADPNKVVVITDQLSATTLTGPVAAESFSTVVGPTYGTVYRGVAFVN
ncbi:MAG TPA: hypothetical protein VHH90_04595 [Polyangia bacterium]|nr:hypothetical protein [Polyangia bacterium]